MLGFFTDITERKRVENELVRTLAREKELGQLRSNSVSMVSHEFRTPLGIIQSSAEILEDYLDQLEPPERQDHLQSIRKNTRRMAETMEEVLLVASFDAGKMEFKPAAWTCRLSHEVSWERSARQPMGDVPSNCRFPKCLLRYWLMSGCCDTFSRIC